MRDMLPLKWRGQLGIVPTVLNAEKLDAAFYPSPYKEYINMPHTTGSLVTSLKWKASKFLSDLFSTLWQENILLVSLQ